ncbi:uncharacterized protein HGUI_02912 [Hanseniaspora guilliermondii]|uniref:Mitochondrial acidic protein MAM33 n=1 Tax=Hanseniaspora guilliermondii TaxID=56406 RepID=A0A1L0B2M1_9ASCO|nr:uncharacterized protein HGUI_02912 [Hanseniaspora guilliermondii]
MLLKSILKSQRYRLAKGQTLFLSSNVNSWKNFSSTQIFQQKDTLESENTKEKISPKKLIDERKSLLNVLKKELNEEIKTREILTTPPSIAPSNGFEVVKNNIEQVVLTLKKEMDEESVYVFVDVDEYINSNFEADNFSYEENDVNEEYANENSYSSLEFVINKKKDNSAMSFVVVIDDTGLYSIEKINYFKDFSLLYSNEANDALKKNVSYGVNFKQLDLAVQEHMINYIDSRGLNEDLLSYIDEIASTEEQRRYENWLSNATKFLS